LETNFPKISEDIAMPLRINPFHQVYFTELIKPDEFTKLFSPFLISDTLSLFQPGNIFLEGVQGSGKSMLLALFKPEIRVEYKKAEKEFPVPPEFEKFLSGGINLIRCGAINFGQRMLASNGEIDAQDLVRYFGDFITYWIIEDLFVSLECLSKNLGGYFAKEFNIKYSEDLLNYFSENLKKNDCWFGYLEKIKSYSELKQTLTERIQIYNQFLFGNIERVPDVINQSTTNPGEPISQVARALWKYEIVPEGIPFYIRIDQCEEMVRLEAKAREKSLHFQFRSIINKMLGTRDPSISYRLGGRRYAFRQPSEIMMHGTTGPIEDFRNYTVIDLDEILRRRENSKTWLFPKFAEDVFRKRLEWCGYDTEHAQDDILAEVLDGKQLPVNEKIKLYIGSSKKGAIKIEEDWPEEVKKCLIKLADSDTLSAKLGEAWVRQQLERKGPDLPYDQHLPWESKNKKWWHKERSFLASLQIAATRAQKMVWARKKDIIDLSGGNILIFLSMLQHIWAAWQRSLPRDAEWGDKTIPHIKDPYIQSEGIEEASDRWYDKIKEEPEGNSRRRFISFLGLLFRNSLRSDKKMSYPGHNGISLTLKDLEKDNQVYGKLQDASAYGVMIDMKHTPKNKSRGESQKWYLHPILAPHFQIPAMRTKEPMYINIEKLRGWLIKAKVIQR
jgi:hypothetical protein